MISLIAEVPVEPDPRDDFEKITEPKTGMFDREFDEKVKNVYFLEFEGDLTCVMR